MKLFVASTFTSLAILLQPLRASNLRSVSPSKVQQSPADLNSNSGPLPSSKKVTDSNARRNLARDPRWVVCPGDGPAFGFMWKPRQMCDPIEGIQCKPGWEQGPSGRYCHQMIDECKSLDNPCKIIDGAPLTSPQCVDLAPDNGLYKCVCPFGVNGMNDLGFGPTSCPDTGSCAFDSTLCDIANDGFCTTNDGESFYCSCPVGRTDTNGDGSSCPLAESIDNGGSGSSCETLKCPSGKVCGTTGTGGAMCVACTATDCDTEGTGSTPVTNNDCSKVSCDSNQSCGIHPDRGAVCLCLEGFWQVHPGGRCRAEIKRCNNCSSNARCNNGVCSCNSGYIGNGVTCVDQNECDLDVNSCRADQGCMNTQGGFECVDVIVEVTPEPTPRPTPAPRPAPRPPPAPPVVIIGALKVTLSLDSNADNENDFVIYNTFDNEEIFLKTDTLIEGEQVVTKTDADISSDGCYTFVLHDTGDPSGTTSGLFNDRRVRVEIGNRVMVNQVLAPANARTKFQAKVIRFGTGCVCASDKIGYDIKLFDTNNPVVELSVNSKAATPINFLQYDNIPAHTFIDTRICIDTCQDVKVTDETELFKMTKVVGNNIDVDANDVKVAEGASNNGDTSILIGDNCCPPGEKLLQQGFTQAPSNTADAMVTRVFDGISSTIAAPSGSYLVVSECIKDPSCLTYSIPSDTGISYLVGVEDTVRSGTVETSNVELEFGTTCAGGNLEISVLNLSATGTTSILLYDISNTAGFTTSDGRNPIILAEDVPNDPDAAPKTLSVSESGCYSFSIINPDGGGSTMVEYSVKFKGETILSGPDYPFPAGAKTLMYDTVRFGSGCSGACPAATSTPVDMKLVSIDKPAFTANRIDLVNDDGSVFSGDLNSDAVTNAVYDVRTCVDASKSHTLTFNGGSDSFLTMNINDVAVIRTHEVQPTWTPFGCTADEVRLTLSKTHLDDATVSFSVKTVDGVDAAAGGQLDSTTTPEMCVPKAECTILSLDSTPPASGTLDGEFILTQDDSTIIASGDTLPTAEIAVGNGCSTVSVTVANGRDSTEVYIYKATAAVTDFVLEEPMNPSSQAYEETFDSSQCYTVAFVDVGGPLSSSDVSVAVEGSDVDLTKADMNYAYFEIGNCLCAAGEKDINIVWLTPPAVTNTVKDIGITQQSPSGAKLREEALRSNFLYNFHYCESADEQQRCHGVFTRRIDGQADISATVVPQNFYSVIYDGQLMFKGIFNRDTGTFFTPGCCPEEDEHVAVVSLYVQRPPPTRYRITREVGTGAGGATARNQNHAGGAGFADKYCFGIAASSDQCFTMVVKEPSPNNGGDILNFGPDGFLHVAIPDTKQEDSLVVGTTDLANNVIVALGSDCPANLASTRNFAEF